MSEQVEVCTCGKHIVRLGQKGEFWRVEGSGEVYKDHHWHKPAPVSQPVAGQEDPIDTHGLIVKWSDDDRLFVARILEMDWCSGHGKTRDEAINMVEENYKDALCDLVKPVAPEAEPSESAGDLHDICYECCLPRHTHPGRLCDDFVAQPSTLPQSSPLREVLNEIDGVLARHRKVVEELAAAWIAAQSQPVAEIPQLVSDEFLELRCEHGEPACGSNKIARELQQYRQRFGKKVQ